MRLLPRSLTRALTLASLAGLAALVPVEPATADRIGAKLKLEKTRFRPGEEVQLLGVRFDRNAEIRFEIHGLKGSCKEGQQVADGVVYANRKGELNNQVYTVEWDDCGWYEIRAEQGRSARPVSFKVKGPGSPPPGETEQVEEDENLPEARLFTSP